MDDSLTITIPVRSVKKDNKKVGKNIKKPNLDGFVEIKKEYIKHLHGSWLKYMCIKTNKLHTGGFLDKIEENKVFLRCPSKDNIVIDTSSNQFFVKENNENYIALLDLIQAHQKEVFSLLAYKKKILQMINDKKIRFL